MQRTTGLVLAALFLVSAVGQANAQEEKAKEPTFAERLVLDPLETCSGGVPKEGDVVALALRGVKGKNYMSAGKSEAARVRVTGPVKDAYSVFKITGTAAKNTSAIYNLGKQKFFGIDKDTKVSATAEPAAAVPVVFEATGDGYVRIKLAAKSAWMRMNTNGYLDFRAGNIAAANHFCVQDVVAEEAPTGGSAPASPN